MALGTQYIAQNSSDNLLSYTAIITAQMLSITVESMGFDNSFHYYYLNFKANPSKDRKVLLVICGSDDIRPIIYVPYVYLVKLIIRPIAIAYSMGQIIKSVCVCVCVCPSASTLTVAFLDRFSPKLAQT